MAQQHQKQHLRVSGWVRDNAEGGPASRDVQLWLFHRGTEPRLAKQASPACWVSWGRAGRASAPQPQDWGLPNCCGSAHADSGGAEFCFQSLLLSQAGTLGEKKPAEAKQRLCCTFSRSCRARGSCPAPPTPAAAQSTSGVSNPPSFWFLALWGPNMRAGIPWDP